MCLMIHPFDNWFNRCNGCYCNCCCQNRNSNRITFNTPNTKDYINFPLPTKTLEEIKDWISEIFEKSNNKKEE
jgi:hypothetical protein